MKSTSEGIRKGKKDTKLSKHIKIKMKKEDIIYKLVNSSIEDTGVWN